MVSLINRLLILACAFQVGSVTTKYIGCLDENGQPTDWFYLYKLPKRVAASGLNYLYLTGTSNGWRLANVTIDDRQSIPGAMISGLTVNDLIIMYNDEPPGEKSDEDRGHTKGVLAANDNSGFWLVHSVPKYPDSDYADYKYPPTGHLYGQSFLCISLKEHQIDLVGQQLKYNEPHVYLGQIPQSLETKYPSLAEVAKSKVLIKDPPFFSLENITGTDFMSFAKSSKFGKELYVDWVAPTLHSHLNVESWLHGSGRIDSECDKPFKVYNIEDIQLAAIDKSFSSMEDHSKWAVGVKEDWICVGDINRAEHQKRRGGGTVCRYSPYVATAYRQLVQAVYPCAQSFE